MGLEFRKPYDGRGNVQPWVKTLGGKSGVYIIKMDGQIVYIGESHSGKLRKTLLRHFQNWTGKTSGNTYPKTKVEVAIVRCPASAAVATQDAMIIEFSPRDNIQGKPSFWDLWPWPRGKK